MVMSTDGFCVVGDCHVDTRGLRAEIPARDTLYPLEQAVRYCLEKNKPLVIAGDLYDKSLPPSRLVNQVNEILEPLSLGGPGCWAIQGNHDKDSSFPWACHARGVKWLGLTPELVGGHELVGLDFLPAGLISQALATIPRCDGLVLHQALKQGLAFEDAWNCDLDWVPPDRARNVWVGDLHRVTSELWSSDHQVRALYTGSQYMTTIEESEHPTFLEVGPVQAAHPEYSRVPLKHRKVLRLRLESDDQVADAIDLVSRAIETVDGALPQELQAPLVLVHYSAELQGVQRVFRDLCAGGLGLLVELPFAPKHGSRDIATIGVRAEEGLTLCALLDRRLPPDQDQELSAFAKELVSVQSIEQARQVLLAWRLKTTT